MEFYGVFTFSSGGTKLLCMHTRRGGEVMCRQDRGERALPDTDGGKDSREGEWVCRAELRARAKYTTFSFPPGRLRLHF